MCLHKKKLIRFFAIDEALKNTMNTYPSKEEIRSSCEEKIFGTFHGEDICASTI